MKAVRDLIQTLNGIVGKTQIIKDIKSGNHGLTATMIGNSYAIDDKVAKKYIATRKKLHAQRKQQRKETKNENSTLPDNQAK